MCRLQEIFSPPKGALNTSTGLKNEIARILRKSSQGQAASQTASSLAPNTNPESWGIADRRRQRRSSVCLRGNAQHNGRLDMGPVSDPSVTGRLRVGKMRGPTSTAVTELLAIPEALPGRPPFQCEDLTIEGEDLQFHYCEIIPCIRNLFGNPEFAGDLVYAPERHYVDAERTCRVYNEMHTGEWWWTVQMSLEARNPGATVIPLIISTDKTQLTLFRVCFTNKTARRHALANLFHSCMGKVLDPIRTCAVTGPGTAATQSLATFVGDYPEQTLVTCTLNGRCPKCLTHTSFHANCRAKGLKPVFRPFWYALPLGVVKHITAWLSDPTVLGAVEVDMRCRSLPPNHYITLFPNGITTLSALDLHLPGGQVASRVLRAVRALLDFVHLAQYPSHTTETLDHLEQSLARFHENKAIFFDLGVRNHLNIPKFHSLLHYGRSITFFGTTDNYNTEQSERLHIDFTKDAYRATNRKDEYAQMTAWLERREKIQIHWSSGKHTDFNANGPCKSVHGSLKMARNPTIKATHWPTLFALTNYPDASVAMLRTRAADTLIPFQSLPVFHRMKFTSSSNPEDSEIVDSVVVRPEQRDARGRIVPSRFDTVLVRGKHQDVMHGTNGNRIAQIRVIFQIPTRVTCSVFLNDNAPTYLAYAEWFSPLSQTPDGNHHMHKVSRLAVGGRRRASVIPVDSIIGSVHLIPRFGPATPRDWNSFSVLELCDTFYVNPFSNRDNYLRFG
ncbi:hypothetical protein BJY52DRAFT_1204730 [Lactarius psammicola]|nr:hypothetical protein BJY52DRAFT_1204730 [Lactarius psammicola]